MPRIFSKAVLGTDRVVGFYDTPRATVAYICSKVLQHYKPGRRILDPAVGDGVFLEHLLRQGVRACDLYGYDIDKVKVAALKARFPNTRVFDATNPFPGAFDFIVGNPPYNGDESHFVRENRARLERLSAEVGAKNTYSIIAYQSIQALKPGGYFSMILSDSFLTNTYYKPFRHFLLRHVCLDEMLLAPWKLFHGRAADVRTCIITGRKKGKGGCLCGVPPSKHTVRLVDRVSSEQEYEDPPRVETIAQHELELYPNQTFLIGVPKRIRALYLDPPKRLGDVVQGGTGISTGNDQRFLRQRAEVQGNPDWVPYYKNGARQPYWYEPEFFIERHYAPHRASTPNYLVRNEKFFFREGLTCSSVGVRFSAAYLPPDCLFGVNANFFFADRESLFYTLGLLNSKLAWYFARRVLIRTNNISANYLRLMPYIEPGNSLKREIAATVRRLVERLRRGGRRDFAETQERLDQTFFDLYKFDKRLQAEVHHFCDDFYGRL